MKKNDVEVWSTKISKYKKMRLSRLRYPCFWKAAMEIFQSIRITMTSLKGSFFGTERFERCQPLGQMGTPFMVPWNPSNITNKYRAPETPQTSPTNIIPSGLMSVLNWASIMPRGFGFSLAENVPGAQMFEASLVQEIWNIWNIYYPRYNRFT